MITAETITDEEIRDVRNYAAAQRDVFLYNCAEAALGVHPYPTWRTDDAIRRAKERCAQSYTAAVEEHRARCAEILNARRSA